jgi:hypothetical protein
MGWVDSIPPRTRLVDRISMKIESTEAVLVAITASELEKDATT